jgi:hypothetical protein
MKTTLKKGSALALALCLGLFGCRSIDTAAKKRPKPEWVVRGPGAFKNQGNVVFYGVGSTSPMPNVALQRKAVDLRAREAVASTLKTSVRSMIKDYMEHSADYFKPNGPASSQEKVEYISQGVVDAELSNCRILDYWEDPENGTLYALAKLDLNDGFYGSYKANLEKALREKGASANILESEKELKALDDKIQAQKGGIAALVGATQEAPKIEPMEEPKP